MIAAQAGDVLASDHGHAPGKALFTLEVLRCNPGDSADQPHWQSYFVELTEGMTLFIALSEIREQQDPSLQFDFVCRAGICGSCAMLINGRPGLACCTLLAELPSPTRLAPLPGFALIGDLSVDTGRWMRGMSERLETWITGASTERDICEIEAPMEPSLAEEIYELERCIECGCCVAACGTAQMHEDFVTAVGLNKLARYRLDPRDDREDAAFYELIGNDDGVFACMSLLGCEDVCPKNLPLSTQIAYLRRAMLRESL
ncbi:fumarate reductase iron-sulfur subunit [Congregibacter litoralis]|uniref:succinate dehydrogenase n=1 Tax=Congregibacter litoralis KT71 TaxID=314285 RepID=A4AD18_9GAMM|nr:fumarate reductase iron-sulfur subunit [Congregibacter litoralis]EAQ96071.1 succinate dehydrogenase subunit B [Congregibacter litoralis KT71]